MQAAETIELGTFTHVRNSFASVVVKMDCAMQRIYHICDEGNRQLSVFTSTSQRPCWRKKQRKSGHVGGEKDSMWN